MSGREAIGIRVDDRERQGRVLEALRGLETVRVEVGRLDVGDYLVDGHLVFERKTFPDLVASIKDGRLFSQGLRLANAAGRAALILEGSSRDLADTHMRREAIQGALVSLTLFLGIPLLRSMDPSESARLMLYAARQGRQLVTGHYARKGRRPHGKQRLQSRILQGLPGVGPMRARRLIEHFGSVEAVVAADPGEIASVPGLGRATAEAIHWAVSEPDGLGVYAGDPWPPV